MKFIELFAGIGGFRNGLYKVNQKWNSANPKTVKRQGKCLYPFNCVWANEIDKYACQIYRKNYGKGELYEGDIRAVEPDTIPDFNLLTAGFPCQSFSIAGKRKGFNDTRGTLFFEIGRIAKHHQPLFMLLENVGGLISHDEGRTLETILETLMELGYYVNYDIYNSKYYSVPQNRERVFFLCTHIKGLISDGTKQRIDTSRRIIKEYLFQIFLKNLEEVRKLQGQGSKDWVMGWLILKEIMNVFGSKKNCLLWNQIWKDLLNQSENYCQGNLGLQYTTRQENLEELKNIEGIILTAMGENKYLKTVNVWENIDYWLKIKSEENSKVQNKSTILTLIKKIIESKTYTYLKMQEAMLYAVIHLRKSQKNYWNKMLSDLILIEENMKYARINNKEEKAVITESGTLHFTEYIQDFKTNFIIGHIRGECRPEVFPVREDNSQVDELQGQVSNTLTARYEPAQATGTYVIENQLNAQIRRLTPIECERLQGFPDNWTKYSIDSKGNEGEMSDTQRYKALGNAVTTNVITAIGERLVR